MEQIKERKEAKPYVGLDQLEEFDLIGRFDGSLLKKTYYAFAIYQKEQKIEEGYGECAMEGSN